MDFELSDEQSLLVEQVRRFVAEEIVPLENGLDPDASELPVADHARLVEKTKAMGLFGIDIPAEFGGPDLDITTPMCVATTGTTGNRRMIVEWPSTRIHGATSGAFGLEIVLNEFDGSIDLLYQGTALSPTSVGIGVENLTGTDSVGGCTTGSSCAVTSSTRIRFVPSP